LISIRRICGVKVSFDRAKEKDLSTLQLLPSLCENKAGGIAARKLATRRLTWPPGEMCGPHAACVFWWIVNTKIIDRFSPEFGEGARCCRLVPRSLRSYRIQDSRLQQVEFCPTEHLSLDIFEPIYLSLCLTIALRRGKGFLNGGVIAADSSEKTFEWIACCGFRLFDPFFQATLFLGSQELAKALEQLQPLFNGLQLQ
jgi:hypothetical protein